MIQSFRFFEDFLLNDQILVIFNSCFSQFTFEVGPQVVILCALARKDLDQSDFGRKRGRQVIEMTVRPRRNENGKLVIS